MGGKPHGIGFDNDFLDMISKTQTTKAKIENGTTSNLKTTIQQRK